tara:strand:- start:1557 stop:1826 length:270 start_codon:yes stop_codon:yes gene_type:complete
MNTPPRQHVEIECPWAPRRQRNNNASLQTQVIPFPTLSGAPETPVRGMHFSNLSVPGAPMKPISHFDLQISQDDVTEMQAAFNFNMNDC